MQEKCDSCIASQIINDDKKLLYIKVIDAEYISIPITLEDILNAVSDVMEISISDLKSKSRKGNFTEGRKFYCLFAKRYTGNTLNKIGGLINCDHSLVLYNIKKAGFYEENELEFKTTYDSIEKKLNLK